MGTSFLKKIKKVIINLIFHVMMLFQICLGFNHVGMIKT